MPKKVFVPCYRMTIKTYDCSGCVIESNTFLLDYFKRDKHNRYFTEIIDYYWCVPFYSSIFFSRVRND